MGFDFAAWCSASQGNRAGTIPSKLAAIRDFHRADVRIELSIRSQLIKSVLRGISRLHTLAGTRPRVRPLHRGIAGTHTFLGFRDSSASVVFGHELCFLRQVR